MIDTILLDVEPKHVKQNGCQSFCLDLGAISLALVLHLSKGNRTETIYVLDCLLCVTCQLLLYLSYADLWGHLRALRFFNRA